MNIGPTIKNIRNQKGLKQIWVAKKAGISNRYLSGIESGKKNPTIKTIENVCKVLGISLEVTIKN